MRGTFPEEVTLTRLMLAQSSNMVRPQGPCARFPMEVAAFPGRGDGLELQIGIPQQQRSQAQRSFGWCPSQGLSPQLCKCAYRPHPRLHVRFWD